MTIAEKLKQARERIAAAQAKLKELRSKATGGTWDTTTDGAALDSAESDLEASTKEAEQLQRMLTHEGEEARQAASRADNNQPGQAASPITVGINTDGRKPDTTTTHRRDFRLLKALRESRSGRLSGLELEVHQEGMKDGENQRAGITEEGIVLPPYMVTNLERRGIEMRDQTAGTAATMGNTIATDLGPMIEFLNPNFPIRSLGARFMTGLTGNLDFARKTARAYATWTDENADATEITNTTDKISMTAKRLPAFTEVSSQLLVQSSIDVENDVRADLNFAIAGALETAAINGSGTAPVPRGILNTSGITTVALGTNGAVPAWANVVALETAISASNAMGGRLGYLTTQQVAGLFKNLKRDVAGNGFIWEGKLYPMGMVNGYDAAVSSLVPSNLTKGSASAICHAIIFGNWQELMIGQWGGVQIIVNPYSLDKSGQVRLTVNSFWDVALRHPASFSAIKDALLS